MRWIVFGLLFTLTCAFLGIAGTITVPDDYRTIQAAIEAAQPGDTVYIKAGRYVENLTITKPLHLVGEDRTKVVIQSTDKNEDVIVVMGIYGLIFQEDVEIEEIEVTGGDVGIYAYTYTGMSVKVANVICYRNSQGILAQGSGEFSLAQSYLVDNDIVALALGTATAHVWDNEVLLGGTGVLLLGAVDATFNDNLIGLCKWGIDTYTTGCGWEKGEIRFSGKVAGSRNRIYGLNSDLCPDHSGVLWPDDFTEQTWRSEIARAVTLNNQGVRLFNNQDYKGALIAYMASLSILANTPFQFLKASIEGNMGGVYYDLRRYEEALAAYQRARVVFASHGMEVDVAGFDQNIGVVCDDLGQYEDALEAYRLARAVYVAHKMEVDVAGIDQNIGVVYEKLGRYEDALTAFQSARAVYASHHMDVTVATIDQNIGVVYEKLGRYKDALAKYKSARAVYVSHHMDVNAAKIDQNIGNVYYDLGRYEDALAKYQSARAVFASHDMELDVAEVDRDIGSLYSDLHQDEDALTKYRSARAVFVSHNMEVDVAGIDQNIGIVYADLGRYEDALKAYDSARAVFVSHGRDVDVATIDKNIGVVYAKLGRYEDALAAYQSARAVFASHQMDVTVAKIDHNIGVVYTRLGRYEDALKAYQSARAVYVSHHMDVDIAKIDQNIGNVYKDLGRYEDALEAYRSARAVYASHDMEVEVAGVNRNMGAIYYKLGRYEEALSTFKHSHEIYEAHGLRSEVAVSDNNIGVIYLNLEKYNDALQRLQTARSVYVACGMELAVLDVDGNIAICYLSMGRLEDALSKLLSLRSEYAKRNMNNDLARIAVEMGFIYALLRRHEQAIVAFDEALEALDNIPASLGMHYSCPSIRWWALASKGLCYEVLGNVDAAISAYKASIAVIESIRGYMKSEEIKTAWQQRTQYVYERLIKLLIEHGQGISAFPYAERCRARTFLDLLAKGPVGTITNIKEQGIKTGVVNPTAISTDVNEVITSLPPNTAALEYFVTATATYVWVIRDGKVTGPITIDHSRKELRNKVIETRKRLEEQKTVVNRDLAELYDWLIRPVADLLPTTDGEGNVPQLIIVPSGPLYYLPFQALIWTSNDYSKKPAPLITRYAISYSPSLATLKYAQQRGGGAYPRTTFLGVADPVPWDPHIPRLPGAQTEARTVAKLFPVSSVYVDKDATEDVVQSHSATAREILLSTHGFFNPQNPLYSYLIVTPSVKNKDGKLHAYEVFKLPLHADMVALSACETLLPSIEELKGQISRAIRGTREQNESVQLTEKQLEELTAGDEVVGLTRAFISAGAASVLSSLWSVPSKSTEELMISFYRHMKEGMDKAHALRAAQLEVMNTSGYTQPWYWAAFNLMGDWR